MSALTRRDCLTGAAVLLVGAVVAQTSRLAPLLGGVPSVFIYDAMLDRHHLMREVARREGCVLQEISGDISATAMSYDKIWCISHDPVIGLTSPAAAFVMQQLAIRRGMSFSIVTHAENGHQFKTVLDLLCSGCGNTSHAQLWQIASLKC